MIDGNEKLPQLSSLVNSINILMDAGYICFICSFFMRVTHAEAQVILIWVICLDI